jgi:hypothetical protein
MEEKFGKVWSVFDVVRQIAVALDGISGQMKRFNDFQERKLKIDSRGEIKRPSKKKASGVQTTDRPARVGKQVVPKKPKRARTPKGRVPEILYNSIIEISREKPEFLAREVINHAMKSAPDILQKQSLNTALQGFKIGSKTSQRQPVKCRNLIVSVEGQRGLYRLNPERMSLLQTESTS